MAIPPGSDCECGRYQDEPHKKDCRRPASAEEWDDAVAFMLARYLPSNQAKGVFEWLRNHPRPH